MTTRTSDWDQELNAGEEGLPYLQRRRRACAKPAERRLAKRLRCWALRALIITPLPLKALALRFYSYLCWHA